MVYTWLANRTMTNIDMDCAPLLGVLLEKGLISSTVYLGTLQWGIETSYADDKMNFSVESFEAGIRTSNSSTNARGDVEPEPYTTGVDGPPVAVLISTAHRSGVALKGFSLVAAAVVMLTELCS